MAAHTGAGTEATGTGSQGQYVDPAFFEAQQKAIEDFASRALKDGKAPKMSAFTRAKHTASRFASKVRGKPPADTRAGADKGVRPPAVSHPTSADHGRAVSSVPPSPLMGASVGSLSVADEAAEARAEQQASLRRERRDLRTTIDEGRVDTRGMQLGRLAKHDRTVSQTGSTAGGGHAPAGELAPPQPLMLSGADGAGPPREAAVSPDAHEQTGGVIPLSVLLAGSDTAQGPKALPYEQSLARRSRSSPSAPRPFRYVHIDHAAVTRVFMMAGLAAELPLLSLEADGPLVGLKDLRGLVGGDGRHGDDVTSAIIGGLSSVQDVVEMGGQVVVGAVGSVVVVGVSGVLTGFSHLWKGARKGASAIVQATGTALSTGRSIVQEGLPAPGTARGPPSAEPLAVPLEGSESDDDDDDDLGDDAAWLHARHATTEGLKPKPEPVAAPVSAPATSGAAAAGQGSEPARKPASAAASIAELRSTMLQWNLLHAFHGSTAAKNVHHRRNEIVGAPWQDTAPSPLESAKLAMQHPMHTARRVVQEAAPLIEALLESDTLPNGERLGGAAASELARSPEQRVKHLAQGESNELVPLPIPAVGKGWTIVKYVRKLRHAIYVTSAQLRAVGSDPVQLLEKSKATLALDAKCVPVGLLGPPSHVARHDWTSKQGFSSDAAHDAWQREERRAIEERMRQYFLYAKQMQPAMEAVLARREKRRAARQKREAAATPARPSVAVAEEVGGSCCCPFAKRQRAAPSAPAPASEAIAPPSPAGTSDSIVWARQSIVRAKHLLDRTALMTSERETAGSSSGLVLPLSTGADAFDPDSQYLLDDASDEDDEEAGASIQWIGKQPAPRRSGAAGCKPGPESGKRLKHRSLEGASGLLSGNVPDGIFSQQLAEDLGDSGQGNLAPQSAEQLLPLLTRVLMQQSHYLHTAYMARIAVLEEGGDPNFDSADPEQVSTSAWLASPERGVRQTADDVVDSVSSTTDPPPGADGAAAPAARVRAVLEQYDVGGVPYLLYGMSVLGRLSMREFGAMYMLSQLRQQSEELSVYSQHLHGALEHRLMVYQVCSHAGLDWESADRDPVRVVRSLPPMSVAGPVGQRPGSGVDAGLSNASQAFLKQVGVGALPPVCPFVDFGNTSNPANATAALYAMLLRMGTLVDSLAARVAARTVNPSGRSAHNSIGAGEAATSPGSDSDSDEDTSGDGSIRYTGEENSHLQFSFAVSDTRRLLAVLEQLIRTCYQAVVQWSRLWPVPLMSSKRVAQYISLVQEAIMGQAPASFEDAAEHEASCDRTLSLLLFVFRGAWRLYQQLAPAPSMGFLKASYFVQHGMLGPEAESKDSAEWEQVWRTLASTPSMLADVQRKASALAYPPFLLTLTRAMVEGARRDYMDQRREALAAGLSAALEGREDTDPAEESAWLEQQGLSGSLRLITSSAPGEESDSDGSDGPEVPDVSLGRGRVGRRVQVTVSAELPISVLSKPGAFRLACGGSSGQAVQVQLVDPELAAYDVHTRDIVVAVDGFPLADIVPSNACTAPGQVAGRRLGGDDAALALRSQENADVVQSVAALRLEAAEDLLLRGRLSSKLQAVAADAWSGAGPDMPVALGRLLRQGGVVDRTATVTVQLKRAVSTHAAHIRALRDAYGDKLVPDTVELALFDADLQSCAFAALGGGVAASELRPVVVAWWADTEPVEDSAPRLTASEVPLPQSTRALASAAVSDIRAGARISFEGAVLQLRIPPGIVRAQEARAQEGTAAASQRVMRLVLQVRHLPQHVISQALESSVSAPDMPGARQDVLGGFTAGSTAAGSDVLSPSAHVLQSRVSSLKSRIRGSARFLAAVSRTPGGRPASLSSRDLSPAVDSAAPVPVAAFHALDTVVQGGVAVGVPLPDILQHGTVLGTTVLSVPVAPHHPVSDADDDVKSITLHMPTALGARPTLNVGTGFTATRPKSELSAVRRRGASTTVRRGSRPALQRGSVHEKIVSSEQQCDPPGGVRDEAASSAQAASIAQGLSAPPVPWLAPEMDSAAQLSSAVTDILGPSLASVSVMRAPVKHAEREIKRLVDFDPFGYAFSAVVEPELRAAPPGDATSQKGSPRARLLATLTAYLWDAVGGMKNAILPPCQGTGSWLLGGLDTKQLLAVAMDPRSPPKTSAAALALGLLVHEECAVNPFLQLYVAPSGRHWAGAALAKGWLPAVRGAAYYAHASADLRRSILCLPPSSVNPDSLFNSSNGLHFSMAELNDTVRALPGLLSSSLLWPPEQDGAGLGAVAPPGPVHLTAPSREQRTMAHRALEAVLSPAVRVAVQPSPLGMPLIDCEELFGQHLPAWVLLRQASMASVLEVALKKDASAGMKSGMQQSLERLGAGQELSDVEARKLHSVYAEWLPSYLHMHLSSFAKLPGSRHARNCNLFAHQVVVGTLGRFADAQASAVAELVSAASMSDPLVTYFTTPLLPSGDAPKATDAQWRALARVLVHLNNILFARETMSELLHLITPLQGSSAGDGNPMGASSFDSTMNSLLERLSEPQLLTDDAAETVRSSALALRTYRVTVHLARAKNLENKDFGIGNYSDPYAVLEVQNDTRLESRIGEGNFLRRLRTPTIRDNLNPVFDFRGELLAERPNSRLRLSMWDEDPQDDDFLGSVTIPLAPLLAKGKFNCALGLRRASQIVPDADSLVIWHARETPSRVADRSVSCLTPDAQQQLLPLLGEASVRTMQAKWGKDVVSIDDGSEGNAERRRDLQEVHLPILMQDYCATFPEPPSFALEAAKEEAAAAAAASGGTTAVRAEPEGTLALVKAAIPSALKQDAQYRALVKKWHAGRAPRGTVHLAVSFDEVDTVGEARDRMTDLLKSSLAGIMFHFHRMNRATIISCIPEDSLIQAGKWVAPDGSVKPGPVQVRTRAFIIAVGARLLSLDGKAAFPGIVQFMLLLAWQGFCIELCHLLLPDVDLDTRITRPPKGSHDRKAVTKRVRTGFLSLFGEDKVAYLTLAQAAFAKAVYADVRDTFVAFDFGLSAGFLDDKSLGVRKLLGYFSPDCETESLHVQAETAYMTAKTCAERNGLVIDLRKFTFPANSSLADLGYAHFLSLLQWHADVLKDPYAKRTIGPLRKKCVHKLQS